MMLYKEKCSTDKFKRIFLYIYLLDNIRQSTFFIVEPIYINC